MQTDQRTNQPNDQARETRTSGPDFSHLTSPGPRRRRVGARLRNYFLTGLIVVGPITITAYILWWFINLIDAWIKPLIHAWWTPLFEGWIRPLLNRTITPIIEDWIRPYWPDWMGLEAPFAIDIPGIGLVFSVIGLMLVGALTANLFGRTVISYGELMLGRMPVVRNLYSLLKQIFETVLAQGDKSFKTVGIIEYPRKGLYSIVFVSAEPKGEIQTKIVPDERLVSVFLPSTPNPTTGFLLYVPRQDITILDMTVEEAAKLVISAGLVEPPYPKPSEPQRRPGLRPKPEQPATKPVLAREGPTDPATAPATGA